MRYEFNLPFPPSFNHAWRVVARRIVLSEEARNYAIKVVNALPKGRPEMIRGPVAVIVMLHPPKRMGARVWDAANREKLLFDCLTKAKVWWDDSQVHDLRMLKAPPLPEHPDGMAVVSIKTLD